MRNLHSRKLKVRTGCVTCKIRKVKCDEAKPACRRCVNTGRKCDGYRGQSRPEDEDTPCVVPVAPDALVPGGSASPFADVAGLSLAISAEDRHLLQYFSTKAGPMFSGLADRKFWSFVLPQLSMSEPAVRHALLAVSTFQAAWEHGSISNQVTNELGYRGSVKHYNLAIANLQQNLTEESTKLEVPLICCLLFICLECLYDERELVLEHLHNGLNILTSPRFKDSWNAFAMSIKPNLQQIFRRLDAQATLFGRPASCRFGDPTEDTGVMISTTFASLYEAQQGLDILMGLALNFIRSVHDASWAAQRHAPSTFITLGRLKAQFETWERGLGQFTATSTHDDASHLEWISRLRIQFFAGYIYLCNSLDKFESSYDAFEAEFRSIVSLARTLVELPGHTRSMDKTLPVDDTPGPNTTSFALDAELIPSLYLTAIKCRNPDIRRDAILMLEKVRFREGLWNAELHARVARRAVEIEEAGMLISQGVTEAAMEVEPSLKMQASGLSLCGPPDEIFRLQGIHIHTLSGRSSRSVPVIFCLAPDGVMEPWKKWEEQIPL